MRGDGIFRRRDREGYFLSWVDAWGRRRKRKAKGKTLGEAVAGVLVCTFNLVLYVLQARRARY